MGHPLDRTAAVLKRMLPPRNMAIRQLSREEGISEATLHKWRAEARGKGQILPDADAGPEGWSSRDKFAAVLETAVLNEADPGEYCRTRGLYPAWIAALRAACKQANDWGRSSTARTRAVHRSKQPAGLFRPGKPDCAASVGWEFHARKTRNAGQAKPATGNPLDPSGSTWSAKPAPLKSETPHEIGGQLL